MKIKILIAAILIGTVYILFVRDISPEKQNQKIKVGVILPLTGIAADYGKDAQAGVQSVASDSIEFIYEDDVCDAKTAVSAFTKLVTYDKVHVIIGPGCGSPQEAIAPLLAENDVLVFAPAAASRDLYSRSSGNFYNIQYSLEDEAKFLANTIFESGAQNVILISYKNAFSETHTRSFKEHFKGNIVEEISFVLGDADVSTELAKLKGKKFDAIVATDISFFFAQGLAELKKFGITVPIYSSYVAELPAVRPFVEGVKYSFPGDIEDDKGATYALSRQAAEIVSEAAAGCGDDIECIKQNIRNSGEFDDYGVFKRVIFLK